MDYLSTLLLLQSTLIGLRENHPRRRATNPHGLLMQEDIMDHLNDLINHEQAHLDPLSVVWNHFDLIGSNDVHCSYDGKNLVFWSSTFSLDVDLESILELVNGHRMTNNADLILDIPLEYIDVAFRDGRLVVLVNAVYYVDNIRRRTR